MPPRRLAPPLQKYASRNFASQILAVLVDIEQEVVMLRKCHKSIHMSDDDPNNPNVKLSYLQQRYEQLLKYLECIPGVLMELINQSLMNLYSELYHQIDQSKIHSFKILYLATNCQFYRLESVGVNKRY